MVLCCVYVKVHWPFCFLSLVQPNRAVRWKLAFWSCFKLLTSQIKTLCGQKSYCSISSSFSSPDRVQSPFSRHCVASFSRNWCEQKRSTGRRTRSESRVARHDCSWCSGSKSSSPCSSSCCVAGRHNGSASGLAGAVRGRACYNWSGHGGNHLDDMSEPHVGCALGDRELAKAVSRWADEGEQANMLRALRWQQGMSEWYAYLPKQSISLQSGSRKTEFESSVYRTHRERSCCRLLLLMDEELVKKKSFKTWSGKNGVRLWCFRRRSHSRLDQRGRLDMRLWAFWRRCLSRGNVESLIWWKFLLEVLLLLGGCGPFIVDIILDLTLEVIRMRSW